MLEHKLGRISLEGCRSEVFEDSFLEDLPAEGAVVLGRLTATV